MTTISIPHLTPDVTEAPVPAKLNVRSVTSSASVNRAEPQIQLDSIAIPAATLNLQSNWNSGGSDERPKSELKRHSRLSPELPSMRPLNSLAPETAQNPNVANSPPPVKMLDRCPQVDQAIGNLSHSILERFPLGDPSIILFVGTEQNPLTAATCASVAAALARRNIGEILLIDSSSTRELTRSFQASDQRGLSNMLTELGDWQSTLTRLPESGLNFMPAGTSHWEHWGAEHRLRVLSAELKRQFQFICVTTDDPQHTNTRIWSSVCNGSFLLVSLKNDHQAIAESAVVELQSCGARLLGCVVTDADVSLT